MDFLFILKVNKIRVSTQRRYQRLMRHQCGVCQESQVDSIWKAGELKLQKMGFEDYGNVLLYCVKKIYTLESVPKGWEFLVKGKS